MSLALELTIFNKLFAAVAEEMGIVLRKSAFSPNIKERRDYSCAVCTAAGELLAQAAHIPVHLGAVPRTMARILPDFPLAAGDVLILNDPYQGGTHLPDLTLIAPVYIENVLAFFLLNRAHHADVGGRTPGSMPLASDLRDEGVIISPTYLYRGGQRDEAALTSCSAGCGCRRNAGATLQPNWRRCTGGRNACRSWRPATAWTNS
jgi:N-methylhydantoinase B